MLFERTCPREQAFTQKEIYLRNQRIIELQRVMEGLNPFRIQWKEKRCNGVLANNSKGHQLTKMERYSLASSQSTKPAVHKDQSYIWGVTACRGRRQSKIVFGRFTNMNHEVTAFGPRHAEHARRFYQAEGKRPELHQVMVPPYPPNYGPKKASYYRQSGVTYGSTFLGDPVINTGVNDNAACYTNAAIVLESLPVVSPPSETVLKVARISARPNRMQQKTSSRVGVKMVNKTVDGLKNKSLSQLEEDLKDAPLFQILCEISKT